MGYPGQDHRQGGEERFLKKIGAKRRRVFFLEKMGVKSSYGIPGPEPSTRGRRKVFEKNRGAEFFFGKMKNGRIDFSKEGVK